MVTELNKSASIFLYTWVAIVSFTLCNFVATDLYAQLPKVSVHIPMQTLTIGDQVNLELKASFNPQLYRVQLPNIPDTFNHIEVIAKGKVDTLAKAELIEITQKITVTSFDSGRWQVPSVSFLIQPLNGDSIFSVQSLEAFLQVQSPLVDTSKPFKPIQTIREAKMPLKEIIMYVVIGLLLIGILVALILYLFKKWRKARINKVDKVVEVQILPHEKALQALDDLMQKKLWLQGEDKLHYTLLTDITRSYLTEQFSIECFEKTSAEIVQQIKRIKLLNPYRQILRDTLNLSDLVKFAKARPSSEEQIQSLQIIKEFVIESNKKLKTEQSLQANATN